MYIHKSHNPILYHFKIERIFKNKYFGNHSINLPAGSKSGIGMAGFLVQDRDLNTKGKFNLNMSIIRF